MKYEQTKGVSLKKDSDQRDHHLDQNAIITTLKQENKKLKEEVFAKQSVINRLMAKTEKNIITSKTRTPSSQGMHLPTRRKKRKRKNTSRLLAIPCSMGSRKGGCARTIM